MNILKTKEDVLNFLEESNMSKMDKETIEPIVEKLLELSNGFEPTKISVLLQITTYMTSGLGILNQDAQSLLLKQLTGYSIEDIEKVGRILAERSKNFEIIDVESQDEIIVDGEIDDRDANGEEIDGEEIDGEEIDSEEIDSEETDKDRVADERFSGIVVEDVDVDSDYEKIKIKEGSSSRYSGEVTYESLNPTQVIGANGHVIDYIMPKITLSEFRSIISKNNLTEIRDLFSKINVDEFKSLISKLSLSEIKDMYSKINWDELKNMIPTIEFSEFFKFISKSFTEWRDKIADYSLEDVAMKDAEFAIRFYDKIKGEGDFRNLFAGLFVTTATATRTVVKSTGIILARTQRFAGKAFKAAKGTLAKAKYEKALRDIRESEEKLDINLGELTEKSKRNTAIIGEIVEELEPRDNEIYQAVITAGQEDGITLEECEDSIIERYNEVYENRDRELFRIANQGIIQFIRRNIKYLPEEDVLDFILNGVEIDDNGKLSYDIEVKGDKRRERLERELKIAKKRQEIIHNMSDEDKKGIMQYFDIVDGKYELKPDVDTKILPEGIRLLIGGIEHKKESVSIEKYNKSIEFLSISEAELLTRFAIQSNLELSNILEVQKEKISKEQPGALRSLADRARADVMRRKASKLVNSRMEETISSITRRNKDISEGLVSEASILLYYKYNHRDSGENSREEQGNNGREMGDD